MLRHTVGATAGSHEKPSHLFSLHPGQTPLQLARIKRQLHLSEREAEHREKIKAIKNEHNVHAKRLAGQINWVNWKEAHYSGAYLIPSLWMISQGRQKVFWVYCKLLLQKFYASTLPGGAALCKLCSCSFNTWWFYCALAVLSGFAGWW